MNSLPEDVVNNKRLLSSKEALSLVCEIPNESEIKHINDAILDACYKGKKSVYIDGSITPQARTILTNNGFEVKYGSQYNDTYVTIKW